MLRRPHPCMQPCKQGEWGERLHPTMWVTLRFWMITIKAWMCYSECTTVQPLQKKILIACSLSINLNNTRKQHSCSLSSSSEYDPRHALGRCPSWIDARHKMVWNKWNTSLANNFCVQLFLHYAIKNAHSCLSSFADTSPDVYFCWMFRPIKRKMHNW